MGYQVITDFRGGLDARKFRLSLPPGTLTDLVNAHITQGAEIEKRKAFVPTSLPANTFGACPVPAGIMVFGSVAPPVMPAGFFYTQLQHPDGATAMTGVAGSDLSGDYPFVAAKFADGKCFCYYNGALVTDFTAGLVMPHLNTNAKIAAALADSVNQSGAYTAIQAPAPNDNDLDVFSQPGDSCAATVSLASTCNITVTTTDDTSFTAAILTSTNGLNAVDGSKLTLGGKDYTFKTALTPAEGEVLIGATIAATMTNLHSAINHAGTPGTDYQCAAANANLYAQNLVTSGVPTFEVVARVANVQGDVENNLAAVTYEDDAPTVTKTVPVQAVGQFKITAINTTTLPAPTYATNTITQDGTTTLPADGDTVTINGQVYTFKAATPISDYQVQIQSSAPSGDRLGATLSSLINVINGVKNFSYNGNPYVAGRSLGTNYPINPYVTAGALTGSGAGATFTLTAKTAGPGGNALTLAKSSAHLGIGGATFSGGTGTGISNITVGAIYATGTVTSNGTNPADGDYVTIGSTTYTFRTVLAVVNDIQIGASANTTLQNLIQAINGTGINNVDYLIANPNQQVLALPSLSSGILRVNSLLPGAAQNAIGLVSGSANLTASGATLAGGSDAVNLLAGQVSVFVGQTLNNFSSQTAAAINAYTPTSGYYAQAIANTIYLYAQAGNSFSNNADITVTVIGQVAIGFCAFLISNGINAASGFSSATLNEATTTAQPLSGSITAIQVDGWNINSHKHTLGSTNTNTGSTTADTTAKTVTGLLSDLAGDINANYPSAIFPYGITAIPIGNTLFIARLITKSSDTALNVNVNMTTTNTMSASQVAQDTLAAVVSPLIINFLRYPIGPNHGFSAAQGAKFGSIIPGFGTAVGALAGALSGGGGVRSKTASNSPIVATCLPVGGYPPYKYQWNKLSGADGFTFSDITQPSGFFSRPDNAGENSALWICTVTDSLGNTVNSNPVKVHQP